MKITSLFAVSALALFVVAGQAQTAAPLTAAPTPASPALAAKYGKLPLSFEANQGQTDPQVKFLSRGQGYALFLTDSAAVLALSKSDPATKLGAPSLATASSHLSGGK